MGRWRSTHAWGRRGTCDLAVPSKEPGFILGAMGRHWRVFKAEDSDDFDFCFKTSALTATWRMEKKRHHGSRETSYVAIGGVLGRGDGSVDESFKSGVEKKWTGARHGSPHDLLLYWIWRVEEREESRTISVFFLA